MDRISSAHFEYTREFAEQYSNTSSTQEHEYFAGEFAKIYPSPDGTLIDLCCGPGGITKSIKHKFNNLKVVGCDQSPGMIEQATKTKTDIDFFLSDIFMLDGKFDYITCFHAYRHFDKQESFWKLIEKLSLVQTKVFIVDILRPDADKLKSVVDTIIDNNENFRDSLTLAFSSAYAVDEILVPAGMKMIIQDTPIPGFKLFFIHNEL
jgi:ubiquinone/menaquinone biosynthesis C-methylase UbiE